MEKSISVSAVLLVFASAYSQGYISYQNDGSALVTYAVPGKVATSADGVVIEMFYQVDSGGAAPAAINASGGLGNWLALPTTGIIKVPGIFDAGILTLPDVNAGNTGPGQLVWINIVGWDNNQPTLAAALGGGASQFGISGVFAYTTGNPNARPPTAPGSITIPSPGAFTGLYIGGIPEPSTLAIGVAGAAALLCFRRRNKSAQSFLH